MNILIVHGPNLNLLGEARGDPCTYAELNARLQAFAAELGASIKIVQSNHEGVLIDTLQAERGWADCVLINPAALTHTSYALRECLRIINRPTIEVHLEDIRRRETWRRRSVIKDVCEAQVMGKGIESYLDGLERLVTGKYRGTARGRAKSAAAARLAKARPVKQIKESRPPKTLGRSASRAEPAKPAKTLGRSVEAADPSKLLKQAADTVAPASVKTLGRADAATSVGLVKTGIHRAAVRERIAARLGRKITPSALATWAREQWLNLERGAATEMGQRELLSETLQTLALSATPAGRLSDEELIDLMTRLE
ncbi:MAG: type II 3-dehydroquinate dehydratase [Myxococcales bacterium]|jgi:3-dehydroquinate dehydratase-2